MMKNKKNILILFLYCCSFCSFPRNIFETPKIIFCLEKANGSQNDFEKLILKGIFLTNNKKIAVFSENNQILKSVTEDFIYKNHWKLTKINHKNVIFSYVGENCELFKHEKIIEL